MIDLCQGKSPDSTDEKGEATGEFWWLPLCDTFIRKMVAESGFCHFTLFCAIRV